MGIRRGVGRLRRGARRPWIQRASSPARRRFQRRGRASRRGLTRRRFPPARDGLVDAPRPRRFWRRFSPSAHVRVERERSAGKDLPQQHMHLRWLGSPWNRERCELSSLTLM